MSFYWLHVYMQLARVNIFFLDTWYVACVSYARFTGSYCSIGHYTVCLKKRKPGQPGHVSLNLDKHCNNFGYYLLESYLLLPMVLRNVGSVTSANDHKHFKRQADNLTLYQDVEVKTGSFSVVFTDNFSLKCLCSLADVIEPTFLGTVGKRR